MKKLDKDTLRGLGYMIFMLVMFGVLLFAILSVNDVTTMYTEAKDLCNEKGFDSSSIIKGHYECCSIIDGEMVCKYFKIGEE